MTAALGDDHTPRDLTRSLTLRLSALLFLILSGGTYFLVSSAVAAKEHDSIVVNTAGRQRMLTQKHTREVNEALFHLAVSDREAAMEMMKAAAQTAKEYEETLAVLYAGGNVAMGDAGRIWIPPVQGAGIVERLGRVKTAWEELRRVALLAMRAGDVTLASDDHIAKLRRQTQRAVAEMDRVVMQLQKQSEAKLRRVQTHMIFAFVLSVVLFVGTVVLVRKNIVTPLKDSMEALREAGVHAEAADRSKSEFLANMSHEIRTPMTAILGFTESLLHTDQSESETLNCIHTIRRNGNYLLSLVNDILDVSKIEAGKMVVEQVPFKPCEIIADVSALMHVRSAGKGLAFNIEYVGAIPETIVSDPTRLRQILINLIGNAIKFTEDGSVRLVARFVADAEGAPGGGPRSPFMQFDVLDTGLGMNQDQAARLFQAFTQADTSMTRRFGGTGLGLTLSKRFAKLLGGDVRLVETEVGRGSVFRATVAAGSISGVKMLDDPVSATVVTNSGGSITQVSPSSLQGCRILLAEDGSDNQRLISFFLKKAGADVTIEENGKLALDAALAARDGDNPFDVILMDMQMPVMDGYEAARNLRRAGYTGSIIALTAHAMATDRTKCVKAGCDDYATKPIDRAKLVETIQRHAARSEPGCVAAT